MKRVTDIAIEHDFCPQRLRYNINKQGIPVIRKAKELFIKDENIHRVEKIIAEKKLQDFMKPPKSEGKTYYQKRYENKKRIEAGLEPLVLPRGRPRVAPVPKKEEPTYIAFDYKGRVKKGIIIGGDVVRSKATIRFSNNGVNDIFDCNYQSVLNLKPDEVETLVQKARGK